MNLNLNRVQNGWILNYKDYDVDSECFVVFEIKDSNFDRDYRENEISTFIDVLNEINSLIGPNYDKYSKFNIGISVVSGNDYDEVCDACEDGSK